MNDGDFTRIKENSPAGTQTLENVRSIHKAVWENVSGRNNGVYAVLVDGAVVRVNRARTVNGVLSVHTPSGWAVPVSVYKA